MTSRSSWRCFIGALVLSVMWLARWCRNLPSNSSQRWRIAHHPKPCSRTIGAVPQSCSVDMHHRQPAALSLWPAFTHGEPVQSPAMHGQHPGKIDTRPVQPRGCRASINIFGCRVQPVSHCRNCFGHRSLISDILKKRRRRPSDQDLGVVLVSPLHAYRRGPVYVVSHISLQYVIS